MLFERDCALRGGVHSLRILPPPVWLCTHITVSFLSAVARTDRHKNTQFSFSLSLSLPPKQRTATNGLTPTTSEPRRLALHTNHGVHTLPPTFSHKTLVCFSSFWRQRSHSRKCLSQSQGKRKKKKSKQLLSQNDPGSPSQAKPRQGISRKPTNGLRRCVRTKHI